MTAPRTISSLASDEGQGFVRAAEVRLAQAALAGALALALGSCRHAPPEPHAGGARATVASAAPPRAAPPAAAPTAAPGPAPSQDPEGCQLRLSPPSDDVRGRPGPVIVHVPGGLLRIAPAGTTLVRHSSAGVTQWATGPRGEVYFADDEGIHVMEPDQATARRLGPALPGKRPLEIVADTSGVWSLWIEGEVASLRSWEIARHEGASVVRMPGSQLGGDGARPNARALAWTPEGLWASTSRGLWRVDGAGAHAIDGESLAGLASAGDRLVRARGHGLDARLEVREGGSWRPTAWRFASPHPVTIEAASREGLVVWRQELHELWLGSLDGDCPPIPLTPALGGRWPADVAIDGRQRVWIATSHGLLVVDRAGRVLTDYLPGTLPALFGAALGVAAPSGGPDVLPVPAPRRRMDVVGQVLAGRYAPLAGAKVRVRVGSLLEREATADARGVFRLPDVPEGRYRVEVDPRPGTRGCHFRNLISDFDLRTEIDCPGDGAVCDVGPKQPCKDGGPMP